ncbi:SIR2 family protein [Thalassotalea nanhaiensis]|uniref:SIR2 family protein n=1 Tax=Thalassotalea nanhaiensis TaxID=3065648 RepID=A0ABY9TG12_9GAMM|nr:SIR2 family protein [Colwelliaceae bacterium SQ345]
MAILKLFETNNEHFQEYFSRIFQSSNINFLFGAGASNPAITVAGDIENKIQELYDEGNVSEAEKVEYDFLASVQKICAKLVQGASFPANSHEILVLSNYELFLDIIQDMLQQRRNSLLPKKVNIFTTNYDLFVEQAALKFKGLVLNDGFQIRSTLKNEYQYETRSFSRTFFETSALYDYKVELPVVNLLKIHGSMTWTMDAPNSEIIKYKAETNFLPSIEELTEEQIKQHLENYYLIYPKKEKFKTTLLNHTYYDLMRIYSNELDKEQTVLIAFGFSFQDEHLFDLTKRALRNSTLKIIIFAFNNSAKELLLEKFSNFNNVDIIYRSNDEQIKFEQFNDAMQCFRGSGAKKYA